MIAVRDQLDAFGPQVQVVVITFSARDNVTSYIKRMDPHLGDSDQLPFPFLLDEERVAYDAYGLGRASTATIYSWRVGLRYRQILKKRGRAALHQPTEDTHQLGGDFVVDPHGRLVYGRWSTGPADRPPIAMLVAATRPPRSR